MPCRTFNGVSWFLVLMALCDDTARISIAIGFVPFVVGDTILLFWAHLWPRVLGGAERQLAAEGASPVVYDPERFNDDDLPACCSICRA